MKNDFAILRFSKFEITGLTPWSKWVALPRLRSSSTSTGYPRIYADFSPVTATDTRVTVDQDAQHGPHITRPTLEWTAFLILIKWRSHQRHLRQRERLPRRLSAAPLLHQFGPLGQSHSRRRQLTELKHYTHMALEELFHSTTQQAWLEGIRVSATDGLSSKRNLSGHCHGSLPLREPWPLVCSSVLR